MLYLCVLSFRPTVDTVRSVYILFCELSSPWARAGNLSALYCRTWKLSINFLLAEPKLPQAAVNDDRPFKPCREWATFKLNIGECMKAANAASLRSSWEQICLIWLILYGTWKRPWKHFQNCQEGLFCVRWPNEVLKKEPDCWIKNHPY